MTWLRRVRGGLRARPGLADGLLAAVLLIIVDLHLIAHPPGWGATMAWSAVGVAPVAVRRTHLHAAIAVLTVHAVISAALGLPASPAALLILTYTAAAYVGVRPAMVGLAVLWLPDLVATALRPRVPQVETVAVVAAEALLALVAFLTGRVVFTRRRYVSALVERAQTAERTQQALAAQAVADERRRIARELHDVVAHHVSVMGVLATGSRRALRVDPAAADEALATIEETGRTALREMRRLLDVLRTEPEPAADDLAPQPGLHSLALLVDQVREAGLPVALHTTGDDATLRRVGAEPGMGLTVYRIVQEALTNVLKHGGASATAEVRLRLDQRWLTLEVLDTGRGPRAGTGQLPSAVGHGLVGMRERVALFGGTLRIGPRTGGGFVVRARLPLDDAAQDRSAVGV